MLNGISLLFALGLGFGLSFWIFGTMLDKSNNIGDSMGSKFDYDARVHFTARRDRMSNSERQTFCSMYAERIDEGGPGGTELVRRLSPEERAEYKKAKAVPRGAYQSASSQINVKDQADEFEEWEKRAGANRDLHGIFKPLDEDPNP